MSLAGARRASQYIMTQEQKVIRAKVGVLELAKQLGNVSQACKMMGYSRDSFYGFKELYDEGGELAGYSDFAPSSLLLVRLIDIVVLRRTVGASNIAAPNRYPWWGNRA